MCGKYRLSIVKQEKIPQNAEKTAEIACHHRRNADLSAFVSGEFLPVSGGPSRFALPSGFRHTAHFIDETTILHSRHSRRCAHDDGRPFPDILRHGAEVAKQAGTSSSGDRLIEFQFRFRPQPGDRRIAFRFRFHFQQCDRRIALEQSSGSRDGKLSSFARESQESSSRRSPERPLLPYRTGDAARFRALVADRPADILPEIDGASGCGGSVSLQ